MKRRDFLRSAGVVSATMAFPKAGRMFAEGTAPETWRTFDVTTSVQVLLGLYPQIPSFSGPCHNGESKIDFKTGRTKLNSASTSDVVAISPRGRRRPTSTASICRE